MESYIRGAHAWWVFCGGAESGEVLEAGYVFVVFALVHSSPTKPIAELKRHVLSQIDVFPFLSVRKWGVAYLVVVTEDL